MNGPIAQLVALAGHINGVAGNAVGHKSSIWPTNSTFVFCDRVKFRFKKKIFFRSKDIVFDNPNLWVNWLVDQACSCAWIWRGAINDPSISDRMNAGFVGGGGNWVINTQMGNGKTLSWFGMWDVWNQEAPEQKIWRVDYHHTATIEIGVPEASLGPLSIEFANTLEAIADFAYKIGAEGFAKSFKKAQASLKGESIDVYHNDLLPKHVYDDSALRCIKACQAAWVFGGMGSWNDMWFEGKDQKEYEELSEKCFSELNNLIVAATNSAAINRVYSAARR